MKDKKIKVLALLPMELPKEIELDNTLEAMQKFVGGLIESIFNLYLGGISTPQDGFSKSRQDVRRRWIVRFFVLML